MNFLLGTPPIKFNSEEYIAVGHMKYNYVKTKVLDDRLLRNKILHFNKACNPNKPGNLIYMMFFYTFSTKSPYEIKRIGHCFIPKDHGMYMLPFPMGIANAHNNKDIIVSYGEADRYVKIMTMKRTEIEKMLMDYESLDAEKYKFIVY